MKSYNAGRLIAEKLKMSDRTGQHVVLCPFHPNTETPSLSLDLDKGVFFCHSACDEPKGGGVVEFLVKWARLVDGKPISEAEARRQVSRSFSIPNAKQLIEAERADELRLFARYGTQLFADALRITEKDIDFITEHPMFQDYKWRHFEPAYKIRDLYEWCFDECLASMRTPTTNLPAVLAIAKSNGWWSLIKARRHERDARSYMRRLRKLKTETTTARPQRTPVKGDLCLATPSQTPKRPKSKRQPVLESRENTTTTTRQPIRLRQPVL